MVCPAVFRAKPPHSLLRACSAGVPCCVQSQATSQSLASLFGVCALLCSEPSHLTVSCEPVRMVSPTSSEPSHLTVSCEPVRRVCPAVFRAKPPHSLLRACSVRRIRRIAQYKKCLVHASMTSHFLYCAAWL